jgi:hypothetical protein
VKLEDHDVVDNNDDNNENECEFAKLMIIYSMCDE